MSILCLFFLVLGLATLDPVFAQSSQLSGEATDRAEGFRETKILVLATPHLSQIEEDFSSTLLDSLIDVLENYSPNIIGIEALSGTQIAEMERRGGVYESVVQTFAGTQLKLGKKAQETLGISWPKADMTADSLLGQVQKSQEVAEHIRLELVKYLLASYRLHTAALQWSYINEDQKLDQSVIPKSSASVLDKIVNSANENASIALRLAHNLNLQRVHPVDDHLEQDLYDKIRSQLGKALDDSTVQSLQNAPHIRKYNHLIEQGIETGNLFPVYKFMNSPSYFKQDKEIQWRNIFLQTEKFNKILRRRLALWEVRNLNIAAHIRKASAYKPGGRILITIGGSHKAFLDAYLNEMMGVDVVKLNDF